MKATRNRNTIMRIALCLPMAALLMATSSFSVTMNTLRMRGFVPPIKRGPPTAPAEEVRRIPETATEVGS